MQIVTMLRQQAHDLWSWDESDDFAIWGPDYQNRSELTGILIYFDVSGEVEIEWLDGADPMTVRQTFGEGLR